MAARPAPVAARGETRALGASRAPSRAPRRRVRGGVAVSRADPEGNVGPVPSSISPDMFGASPGPRSPALHRAARWGDVERARRLLDTQRQDVNETDANGSTALMWACQFGHDDVVEALLRRGADPRARNRFNWSALEYASTSSLAGDVLLALLPEYYPGVVSRLGRRAAAETRAGTEETPEDSSSLSRERDGEEKKKDASSSFSSLRTRALVPPAALSGAYGALLGDWSRYVLTTATCVEPGGDSDEPETPRERSNEEESKEKTFFRRKEKRVRGLAPFAPSGTRARSLSRARAVVSNAMSRYAASAATSFRDARDALSHPENGDSFRAGGVVIAGCTRKPLGLYAGQRYEVRELFWRARFGDDSRDERLNRRVPASSADDPRPSPDHVLCAELQNPTWTPWGSIEVEVAAAELRSVRDELRWASGTAFFLAAFFVAAGTLLRGGFVSVASVPSESMAPGIRRGDAVLVDKRRATVSKLSAGDVVLFAPPPKLVSAVTQTRGFAPSRGEFFVKRVVAVAGDELEIVHGAVFRNGKREEPYATGTPVGVTRDEHASFRYSYSNEYEYVCPKDVCKPASYDLRKTRVPNDSVFVLGDNRGGSVDGHVWGYLPLENVRGVVRFRVGPLRRFGALLETPVPPKRAESVSHVKPKTVLNRE